MLKKTQLLTTAICAVAILAIGRPAHAQIGEFKIIPSDGAEGDYFGSLLSISGDYAVVGTFSANSAYVFHRTGTSWVEEAILIPPDGAAGYQYGRSVSISGDYVVVGSPGDNDNGSQSGSAYVFKRSGTSWAQEAKLLASDGAASDVFGWSVAISGDYAVVGAIGASSGLGSAYVFLRSGTSWSQQAKLTASDGANSDRFGESVAISGDYAVVGAQGESGSGSGSAYVFKLSGTSWTQEAKLLPSDGATGDIFGFRVSISGDYAVVGAHGHDDNGSQSGSAYVFKRTGTSWAEEVKLLPSDGAAGDRFGWSVSIFGDYAAVGAYRNDDDGDNSGSAYLFKRTGTSWAQALKLLASDGAADNFYGIYVSISGDYVLVGADADDVNDFDSGSAYVYNGFIQPFNIEVGIAEHVEGNATGLVGYRVADISALTYDQYEITFNEVESIITFNLENLSTATKLLELHPMPENIYSTDIPITEGFKIVLDFSSPNSFLNTEFTVDADPSDGDLILWGDATVFGFQTGLYSEIGGGGGSAVDVSMLQRDLQLRFTGVATDNFDVVTSGGSIGTQYPRSVLGEPNVFSGPHVPVRLPFELWDVENDRQINVAVINRNADGASPYGDNIGDPNTPGLEPRWRITGRDYFIPVMIDYDPNTPIDINDPLSTWMLFFEDGGHSFWSTGDVFTIEYPNPIEPGIDVYRFQGVPTAIESEVAIPENFKLSQNYPNPFNPVTTIQYKLPFTSDVKLIIYNLLGQEVFRLEQFAQLAGNHRVIWDASSVASGVYFYRLQAGDFVQTRKMVLLK